MFLTSTWRVRYGHAHKRPPLSTKLPQPTSEERLQRARELLSSGVFLR